MNQPEESLMIFTGGGKACYDRPPQDADARLTAFTHYGGHVLVHEVPPLSNREVSCTVLTGLGMPYADIGEELGLSTNTIKTTLRRSYFEHSIPAKDAISGYCLQKGYLEVIQPSLLLKLTVVDTKILDLLSRGVGEQYAANKIGISINTVKTHLKLIKKRNGAAARTALISRALFSGQI